MNTEWILITRDNDTTDVKSNLDRSDMMELMVDVLHTLAFKKNKRTVKRK